MKIHEYQGKELLRKFGVPVPRGLVARSPEEAYQAAKELGTDVVVVKAQIHAGGRGKGGGVKLAKSPNEAREIAQEMLGMNLVTFHAGFLPHEESDPGFKKLNERVGRIADLFAAKGIQLGFETGQETATCLQLFLAKLDRPTVGVNFDPANLILYDKGDPIDALRLLGPWLKQCHIKDATRTRQPGRWGEEVVVGTGEVNWPAFFQTLNDLKFPGYLCIEREAGTQRVQDIRAGRQYLESVLA